MVSLGSLPALQLDTNTYSSGSPLQAYRSGMAEREDAEKSYLAKAVGEQAATGDYLAASRTAFKGGDLQTGQALSKYHLDLNNMGSDQRLKVAKFMMDAGAKADTPEKWRVYTGLASNIFGAESVAPYLDFNSRPGAMTEMERVTAEIEGQIKKAELDSKLRELQYGKPEKLGKGDRYVRFNPTTGAVEDLYSPAQNPADAALGPYDDAKQVADVEAGVRKEIAGKQVDFVTVRDAYTRLEHLYANTRGDDGNDPNAAAADIGMVYSVMKMFDPGSVVRETEYATAQNATGVPEQVRNMWNRVLSGERLSPSQRSDFLRQGKSLYRAAETTQRKLQDQYKGLSTNLQVRPDNVVLDATLPQPPSIYGNVPSGVGWNPVMSRFEYADEAGQYQAVPQVASPEDAMKLPSGTIFITPDGRFKTRP